MKLFIVFLLVAAISATTKAQGSGNTSAGTTEVTTEGPTAVTSSSENVPSAQTSDDTTVSTGQTSADTTVTSGQTSDDTTVPSGETSGDTTVPNGETPTDTTVPSGQTSTDTTVPSGQTSVDTTVPSEQTSADTTVPSGETTTETTVPTGETTTTTPSSETTAAPNVPNVNTLQCYSCADDDCNEKVVIKCAENGTPAAATAFLLRSYRSISRDGQTDVKAYACYSIKVTVDDTKKEKLGCIAIPNGESACQAVRKELQLTTDDANDECRACQTNECNGCTMAKLSAVQLLCIMLIKVFI